MNENIKAFLQKVAEDKELQERFKEIKDPDKAYELAASVQDGFSKDEFITVMTAIHAKMSRDLSDDDLEKAAGGGNNTGVSVCMCVPYSSVPAAATAAF